nr:MULTISPECIES: hypothetical protein [Rickettsia]
MDTVVKPRYDTEHTL